MIRMSLYNGLLVLEKLDPKAIAHLTSLSIWFDDMPHIPCKSWHPCGQNVVFCARPLNRMLRHDRLVIEEWRSAARHLALNMQPSGLTLTLACNANDVETANDLVEPPMKMPPLKECAIRLADDPTKADLQQLASHV